MNFNIKKMMWLINNAALSLFQILERNGGRRNLFTLYLFHSKKTYACRSEVFMLTSEGKKMKDLVKSTMYSIHGCAPCLWPSLQESRRSQSQITLCIKKRLVLVEQK